MSLTYLEFGDKLRWLLTGERCLVIPSEEEGEIGLRWPSGERKSYKRTDPIWRYFELAERNH
jgi:hypothetical protein